MYVTMTMEEYGRLMLKEHYDDLVEEIQDNALEIVRAFCKTSAKHGDHAKTYCTGCPLLDMEISTATGHLSFCPRVKELPK